MIAPIATAILALAIFAATTPCLAQDPSNDLFERILAELETIRERLDAAEKRLGAIEERRARGWVPGFPFREPGGRAGSSLYSDLELPPDPTLDQAREYVREIKKRNSTKDCWFIGDPEARLLARVGKKNLLAILEVLDNEDFSPFNQHGINAVKRLADDGQIGMVLERLPFCHALAKVILGKGWEEPARDALLEGLSNPDQTLPQEWIHALVRLRDPRTYGTLLDYFRTSLNFETVYTYICEIEDLPSGELDAAVREIWTRKFRDESHLPIKFLKDSAAKIAVRHGHVDALGHLLAILLGKVEQTFCWKEEIRELVLSLIPVRGTNEELHTWFEKNRARLTFDRRRKKYIIKGR